MPLLLKLFHITPDASPDNQGDIMTEEEPQPPVIIAMDSHNSRSPEDPSTSYATAVVTGSTTVTMDIGSIIS